MTITLWLSPWVLGSRETLKWNCEFEPARSQHKIIFYFVVLYLVYFLISLSLLRPFMCVYLIKETLILTLIPEWGKKKKDRAREWSELTLIFSWRERRKHFSFMDPHKSRHTEKNEMKIWFRFLHLLYSLPVSFSIQSRQKNSRDVFPLSQNLHSHDFVVCFF